MTWENEEQPIWKTKINRPKLIVFGSTWFLGPPEWLPTFHYINQQYTYPRKILTVPCKNLYMFISSVGIPLQRHLIVDIMK